MGITNGDNNRRNSGNFLKVKVSTVCSIILLFFCMNVPLYFHQNTRLDSRVLLSNRVRRKHSRKKEGISARTVDWSLTRFKRRVGCLLRLASGRSLPNVILFLFICLYLMTTSFRGLPSSSQYISSYNSSYIHYPLVSYSHLSLFLISLSPFLRTPSLPIHSYSSHILSPLPFVLIRFLLLLHTFPFLTFCASFFFLFRTWPSSTITI